MKHSYKRRRPKRPTKPDNSASFSYSPNPALANRPLQRYRTRFSADDVITLIQSMDMTNKNTSCRVVFDPKPRVQGEGIQHHFYIEYYEFKILGTTSEKYWRKVHLIAGEVTSGLRFTAIEFKSTRAWWARPIPLKFTALMTFIMGFLTWLSNFFPSWFGRGDCCPSAWFTISTIVTVSALFLPWFMLLWYRFVDPILWEELAPALKTLEAVKINDELAKRKNDEAATLKQGD